MCLSLHLRGLAALLLLPVMIHAQEPSGYQTPPAAMAALVDAPLTPFVSVSPGSQWLLIEERPSLPGIEEVAQPQLRLGGLRINPRVHGNAQTLYSTGLSLQDLASGETQAITGLPSPARLEHATWSPDGAWIACTHTTATAIELWVVEVATRQARRLPGPALNGALYGAPFAWLPDSKGLLCRELPANLGTPPAEPLVPAGPVIQESSGSAAAVRTYQDLIKSPHDEALFAYYLTANLSRRGLDDSHRLLAGPGLLLDMAPSPDGQYLRTDWIEPPFSYLVPYYRFPRRMEILDREGQVVRVIARRPAGENIPKGFMATVEGPRDLDWRADAPATLYWVEALDGGDPAQEVPFRDALFYLSAPFTGAPVAAGQTVLRFNSIRWGRDDLAIITDYWWNTREMRESRMRPGQPEAPWDLLSARSMEDRYQDPGRFVMTALPNGARVLLTANRGRDLFRIGNGASPEGDRPFVDVYRLADGETRRLWRSEAPHYAYPVDILDPERPQLLLRRESQQDPANYFSLDLKRETLTQLTDFPHPYPTLREVEKQLIRYERADGLSLTGNLYLPPGYDPARDGRIPVLLWAYPEEFKSADAAGQVSGSPYRFIRLSWASPLYWLLRGYAILDDPGMPIIGEGEAEPNDTFVPQLVANAQAAIDKLVAMGIADPDRVAVGGHSYGAFMTANLLAHSELFACGIARSGAYNRTLTPFGFQSEERTYWEAAEVYHTMSPFSHADRIKTPILLIHGEADNNSGTFPLQSERFFHALKGHGAPVRLVMLPHESHSYRARESILHMLWEMDRFLEAHLGGE